MYGCPERESKSISSIFCGHAVSHAIGINTDMDI